MKILFLSANPIDTPLISLDEEMRSIQQELAGSTRRNEMYLKVCPAARSFNLIRELNREKPEVLHISSHGASTGEILFKSEAGDTVEVSPAVMSELFEALQILQKIILLNCCFSFEQAHALSRIVEVVVGIDGALLDQHAIQFSKIFYKALSEGASVSSSFKQAVTGVKFDNSNYWQYGEPSMLTNKGSQRTVGGTAVPTSRSRLLKRHDRNVFRDRDKGRGYIKRDVNELGNKFTHLSFIFFDVDGMNQINTQFGRFVGNRVLAQIVVLLEDNAPLAITCGICGDDTFFCILEEGIAENVKAVGRKLTAVIENHDWKSILSNIFVRVSGGYAVWQRGLESVFEAALWGGLGLRLSRTSKSKFDEEVKKNGKGGRKSSRSGISEEVLREIFS